MKFREPPKLATRILSIFGRHYDNEAILGDLCERYQIRPSSTWYWRQTLIEILDTLMRNSVIFRLAIWASLGFLVSVSWGFYFATADKTYPIRSTVYALAFLSQPAAGAVTVLFPDLPVGLWPLVGANAAIYALLGLIVETIRLHIRTTQGNSQ